MLYFIAVSCSFNCGKFNFEILLAYNMPHIIKFYFHIFVVWIKLKIRSYRPRRHHESAAHIDHRNRNTRVPGIRVLRPRSGSGTVPTGTGWSSSSWQFRRNSSRPFVVPLKVQNCWTSMILPLSTLKIWKTQCTKNISNLHL